MRRIQQALSYKKTGRIIAAFILGTLFFWLASSQVQMDCKTLHVKVYNGGPQLLGTILIVTAFACLVGLPFAVLSMICGLLTTPLTGSSIASLALVLSSLLLYLMFRFINESNPMIQKLESVLSRSQWHKSFRSSVSNNGTEWYYEQCLSSPLPFGWLAAYCGSLVKHLSPSAMLSGLFLATIAPAIGYSFAGSVIGCALIDRAQGHDVTRYAIPALISAVLVWLADNFKLRFQK